MAAMINQFMDFKFKNDEEFDFVNVLTQDNIPAMRMCEWERYNGNNGFSKNTRAMRKIASIPQVAMIKAEAEGYNLNCKADLYSFLQKYPEFMTVEHIKTVNKNCPNVIIH